MNELFEHFGEPCPAGSYYNPKQTTEDGAIVPPWLIGRNEVRAGAKIFFALLIQLCPKDSGGKVKASQHYLAERLGVTDKCIRNWNKELASMGLIQIIRHGRECIYRFLQHDWMRATTCQ